MRLATLRTALLLTLPFTALSAQAGSRNIRLDLALRVPAEVANLGSIGTIVPTRDGGLAIIDYDANAIRFFSAAGAEVGVFGRQGEGPGEFRTLNAIGWVGDTLWVSDYRLRRITFISPIRALIRSVPFPAMKPGANGPGVVFFSEGSILAVYRDGSMALSLPFARVSTLPSWAKGHTLHDTPILRFSPGASTPRVIGWTPSSEECDVRYDLSNGFGALSMPFCESTLTGNAPDGSVFATVTIGRVDKGTSTYHVTLADSKGTVLFSRDYQFMPQVIPGRVVDSTVNAKKAYLRSRPAALRAFSAARFPYAYPPLRALLVGADSTLWLEQRVAGGAHRWIGLNSKGESIGVLELPRNSTLVAADRQWVWVTEMSEDGVSGWARFAITR